MSNIPSAPMAEKAILSVILRTPEVWLARAKGEGLTVDHFHIHSPLWRVVIERNSLGKPLELVSLIQDAALDGTLDNLGGPGGVTEVFGYASEGMTYAWPSWVAALRETLALRLAARASSALSECESGDDAAKQATKALEAISGALRGPKKSSGGKELAADFLNWFEESHAAGDIPGLSTGIDTLDIVSGGMRPGELIVICGKPSRGKSVLMLQLAANVLRADKTVAVFSLEMMRRDVVGRLIAYLGKVDFGHITQPRGATRGDLGIMQRIIRELAESNLWVSDEGGVSVDAIAAEAERIRDANGGLDLVVVDYIQLCDGERERGEKREQEVARVSAGLKKLAKRLGCPVITGSQLNADGQTRESRAIEQDADWLLFIVEDGVKIGKMRNAQRDQVLPLFLNGEFQRFDRQHVGHHQNEFDQ